jgi:hypothetical protein
VQQSLCWRVRQERFQLVGYSTAQLLRFWKISVRNQIACKHSPVVAQLRKAGSDAQSKYGDHVKLDIELIQAPDPERGPASSRLLSGRSSTTLQQEFIDARRMCDGLKNIDLQEMSITARKISVLVNGKDGAFSVPIGITFPTAYPHSALPGFIIHPVKTGAIQVDIPVLKRIREKLIRCAEEAVQKHECCLSMILREASKLAEECIQVVQTASVPEQIEDADEEIDVDGDDSKDPFSQLLEADGTFKIPSAENTLRKAGLYHRATDNTAARQPCPRLCGASFSATGRLVCFTIKVKPIDRLLQLYILTSARRLSLVVAISGTRAPKPSHRQVRCT